MEILRAEKCVEIRWCFYCDAIERDHFGNHLPHFGAKKFLQSTSQFTSLLLLTFFFGSTIIVHSSMTTTATVIECTRYCHCRCIHTKRKKFSPHIAIRRQRACIFPPKYLMMVKKAIQLKIAKIAICHKQKMKKNLHAQIREHCDCVCAQENPSVSVIRMKTAETMWCCVSVIRWKSASVSFSCFKSFFFIVSIRVCYFLLFFFLSFSSVCVCDYELQQASLVH